MRPVKTARLGGRRYRIHLDHRLDGSTDVPGAPENPFHLYVDTRLQGQALLETIIHEATHAVHPKLSEQWTTRIGRDVARLLWRLGYRRMEQED